MDTTEILGLAAGVCTSVSLLPQLIKIKREKKADDISLFYLIVLLVGLILWIWYGIKKEDIPIVATNCFSLALNVLLIIMGVKYKKQTK